MPDPSRPRPRGLRRPGRASAAGGYWGNVNPIGPRSCYDEGKRCAETLFFDYHRQHGLEIKVARIFNTYGPRMHHADGGSCRTSSCRRCAAIRSRSTARAAQTRSFCYVDDLVEGFMRLMDTSRDHRSDQPRQSGRVHDPGAAEKVMASHVRDPAAEAARGRELEAEAARRGPDAGQDDAAGCAEKKW
jgi:nucleoside-diphosphate-sugar epimerase